MDESPVEIGIWCANIIIQWCRLTLLNECQTNKTENQNTSEEGETPHPWTQERRYNRDCLKSPCGVFASFRYLSTSLFVVILIRSVHLYFHGVRPIGANNIRMIQFFSLSKR